MPVLQRNISMRGPRFWYEGETLMFGHVLDGSTVLVMPREATTKDHHDFPAAYEAALAGHPDHPGQPMITARNPEVIPPPAPKPYAARRDAARQGGAE